MATQKRHDFLSLAIPFYNEEGNIRKCIADHMHVLNNAGINFEIIAVDNASTDATAKILESLKSDKVKVLHIEKNIGYGNGIMHGWKAAKGNYLGFTGGDNEVSADSVVQIFRKVQREGLDLGKSKRIKRTYSWFRKLKSHVYNTVFCRLLLGYTYGDVNGYPKIMKRSLYEKLKIKSPGPFFETEIMLKSVELGAKIGFVTIEYKEREKGESKIPNFTFFITGMIRFKLRRLFGSF